jgi:UDP-2-acetamido-3-amino-2,3-dideoxy-glucuronate N-acetyltransferase
MPNSFKLAHIGCGYWGKNLLRTFNNIGCLAAAGDVSQQIAKNTLAELDITVPALSLSDILENKSFNAVSISTPANTHFDIAKQALEAGKHVYLEKPMTLDSHSSQALIDLANQNNLMLQVGHLLLFHPAFQEIKKILDSGQLGDVTYIHSSRLNWGKVRQNENIFWSFLPHDISLILYLINSPVIEISNHSRKYVNDDIADMGSIFLRHDSGLLCHLSASWLHPVKEHKFTIVGSKKSIVFKDHGQKNLSIFDTDIESSINQGLWAAPIAQEIPFNQELPLDIACNAFVNSCQNNIKPIASGENGLDVINILSKLTGTTS